MASIGVTPAAVVSAGMVCELLYIFVTNRNCAPMRKEKGSRRHWVYITVYA